MSEPIRPKQAWDSFKVLHDQIQERGLVSDDVNAAVKVVQDFIRQKMEAGE